MKHALHEIYWYNVRIGNTYTWLAKGLHNCIDFARVAFKAVESKDRNKSEITTHTLFKIISDSSGPFY